MTSTSLGEPQRTYVLNLGRGWNVGSWFHIDMEPAKKPLPSLRQECPGEVSPAGHWPCWKAWVLICFFILTSTHRDKERLVCWAQFLMVISGFKFSWSMLSQKESSNGHERWMKSGSLPSAKRSPACAALQCSQSDLLLSGATTQVSSGTCIGPDVHWEKGIGCTGRQIWKWHWDSGWEIQASP